MMKTALLIAGAGTLGSYTSKELLALGHKVDVICLEDMTSQNENLTYYRFNATVEALTDFLSDRHYDAIVNFLHFPTAEQYKPYHALLITKTEQLVFLSSYRIYADEQHPITESAPWLGDVIRDDPDFLAKETYAMGKTRCERYLRGEAGIDKVTIIRPVISFSSIRLDILMHTGHTVIDAKNENRALPMPIGAQNRHAGLDWAGNSGKLIANLLFKPETLGQTYTISSGQNATWGEVAGWYEAALGVKFEWVDDGAFADMFRGNYAYVYDRAYDRAVDASAVFAATGLTQADFLPIRDAIALELDSIL